MCFIVRLCDSHLSKARFDLSVIRACWVCVFMLLFPWCSALLVKCQYIVFAGGK